MFSMCFAAYFSHLNYFLVSYIDHFPLPNVSCKFFPHKNIFLPTKLPAKIMTSTLSFS